MPSHASSWDSNTLAGPLKRKMSSLTPAVLTMQPSGARLPESTARPPSAVYAWATSRMHPAALSLSSSGQLQSWEASSVLNFPAGALEYIFSASSQGSAPFMS